MGFASLFFIFESKFVQLFCIYICGAALQSVGPFRAFPMPNCFIRLLDFLQQSEASFLLQI